MDVDSNALPFPCSNIHIPILVPNFTMSIPIPEGFPWENGNGSSRSRFKPLDLSRAKTVRHFEERPSTLGANEDDANIAANYRRVSLNTVID